MSFSQLPSVHPFLVHFPIALFTMALAIDVSILVGLRVPWMDRAALLAYAAAAVIAIGSAWTGTRSANDLAAGLDPSAAAAVSSHGDWAFFTVVLFFLVLLPRVEATWRDRASPRPRMNRARLLALPLAILAEGSLLATAGRGGELVYRYGVGVDSGRSEVRE